MAAERGHMPTSRGSAVRSVTAVARRARLVESDSVVVGTDIAVTGVSSIPGEDYRYSSTADHGRGRRWPCGRWRWGR